MHGGWSLLRKRMRFVVGTRGEGVGAVVKHLLGQMMRVGGGLDPQVAEHGIGLPTAEELDVVFVDTRTEEGSGPTWAQRAAAQQVGFNASVRLDALSSVAQGVGDECRVDRVPLLVEGIEVAVERRVLVRAMLAGSSHKAGECLGGTELGVGCCDVADSFAAHGVLLVREGEAGIRDAGQDVLIIQRCREGGVVGVVNLEADGAKLEGLRARFLRAGLKVFGWP